MSDPGTEKQKTTPREANPPTEIAQPSKAAFPTALEGRYRDIQEIRRGGMGVAYRAYDRETGDRVALKQLIPEIAHDPELRERFKRELVLARKATLCRI